MTRMTILDQDTREELAEFGMVPVPTVKLCKDCRFSVPSDISMGMVCEIEGRSLCEAVNPRGLCDRHQRKTATVAHYTAMAHSTAMVLTCAGTGLGVGMVVGFILGVVIG